MSDANLFEDIGGTAACRRLARIFYERVEIDPLLRPLFPGKTLKCAREAFSAYLVQFLGGPSEHSQLRWHLSLRESHRKFPIGYEHRAAWLRQMGKALEHSGIEEPANSALREWFAQSSSYVIGVTRDTRSLHPELALRWRAQRMLDDCVEAVHAGQSEKAISLAAECGRAVLPGICALMMANEIPALLSYVEEQIAAHPELVHERYAGRTLLHAAAGSGRVGLLELLLKAGADSNAWDGGKHTPLYAAGNECQGTAGAAVVHTLVEGGAHVNACDGVTRCTPLHMAARRGNASTAEALLDCGADIHARDSNGATPLRRAINCRKTEVESLLRSRGAV